MQRAGKKGLLTACLLVLGCEAAPSPATDTSATAAPEPPAVFDQAVVDAVVVSHRDALAKKCAAELRRATDRRVDLIFEIDANGAVKDATVAGGGSAERPLRQCVEKELGTWKFPTPGSARTVQASLTF